MEGWIKLYRKLLDSSMYRALNSKQRDVMIACLILANHTGKEWEWEGEPYKCDPGQFVTSLDELSKKVAKDVKVQSIRTALLKLEKWCFLTNKSTKTGRLVTICNWDKYQTPDNEANKGVNKEPTKRQQRANKELTPNKNVKKEKNEEEYKSIVEIDKPISRKDYPKFLLTDIELSDEEENKYLEIALSFQKLFIANLEEAGASTIQIKKAKATWINDVRLMLTTDGYTVEDMRKVYNFLQTDPFWKANILSTKKLREKMATLKLKIHKNGTDRKVNKEATSWNELAEIIGDSFSQG